MNLMRRGANMLNRTLGVAAGVSVVYARGAVSHTITATPAETAAASDLAEVPGRVDYTQRDYTIAVAELVRVGFPIPQRGDRVTETINGEACIFRLADDDFEPSWRYSDQTRTRFRVHCERVA